MRSGVPVHVFAAAFIGATACVEPAAGEPPALEQAQTSDACQATSPRPGKVGLVVAPDDGDRALLALIGGAARAVDVSIYELSSRRIITALKDAARRPGVHVRILHDADQHIPGVVDELRAAGVEVHLQSYFAHSHQKTVTVDARATFVFSGNLDRASFWEARNVGVVDQDPDDVADFEELFHADWEGRRPNLACTRLVVAPINARSRLVSLVEHAERTLDVEAMYITDRQIVRAIASARSKSPPVSVRVLVNDPTFGIESSEAVAAFRAAGIEVRHTQRPAFVHAKLILADDKSFVGSENFSFTSLDRNREAGIVLTEDTPRLREVFEADWTAAQPFR
jgi:cardiolipin synthase A/B